LYTAYIVNPTSVGPTKVEAAPTSLTGYAWSDTIGYISFSCTTCGAGNHAVTLDQRTGDFSGIAWSSDIDTVPNPDQGGIGWISFNRAQTGNPPSAPYNTVGGAIAKTDMSGNVTGWARALAACDPNCATTPGAGPNTGGWDGWIKLSDSTWTNGVKINPDDGKFSGYAWGGAQTTSPSGDSTPGGVSVIGWINFSGTAQDSSTYFVQGPPLIPVCSATDSSSYIYGDCQGTCVSGGVSEQTVEGFKYATCLDGTVPAPVSPQSCTTTLTCTDIPGELWIVGDGICNTGAGENSTNSLTDCKPKTRFWQF